MSLSQLAITAEPVPADRGWWALESLDLADAPGRAPEPSLPFPELVAVQAAFFRSKGTPFFDWLAREVDDLAALARSLNATSPETFDDRRAQQERWLREREDVLAWEGLTGC
jgi:hypothetical protein